MSSQDCVRGDHHVLKGARSCACGAVPPDLIGWMACARDSHRQWAEHLDAHAASGEPCAECAEKPYKLDAVTEREWVRRYDLVTRAPRRGGNRLRRRRLSNAC
jgi:hypothetical protein